MEFSHVIERDFCHNVLNKNLNFAAVINLVNLFFIFVNLLLFSFLKLQQIKA